MTNHCPDCGLPTVECSALTIGREAVERWLRDPGGYDGQRARDVARRLIPDLGAQRIAAQKPKPLEG